MIPPSDLNNGVPPQQHLPFRISLIVTQKNNKPAVELRRLTTNLDVIKVLVTCAFHRRPVILIPEFTDNIQSINSLIEKGILYKNREDEKYYFTI